MVADKYKSNLLKAQNMSDIIQKLEEDEVNYIFLLILHYSLMHLWKNLLHMRIFL